MTQSHCDALKEQVQAFMSSEVRARPLGDNGCLLNIPFRNNDGDPIRVGVIDNGETVTVHDVGAIAGHLFELGQHTQDTPAFKLLKSLESAYGLKLDYDNGLVTTKLSHGQMPDGLMNFSKVILTMVTAMPHIRIQAHRAKAAGPRVRAKIMGHFKEERILDLVEHDHLIPGQTVDTWRVDFHWWVKRANAIQHIYVKTVDLDVIEALPKAANLTMMALDVRREAPDQLRIVVDRHGSNSEATIAASVVKRYGPQLHYNVYDFDQDSDRRAFLTESFDEIMSDAGAPWRAFWTEQVKTSNVHLLHRPSDNKPDEEDSL